MVVSNLLLQRRFHDNDFPEGVKGESSKYYTYLMWLREHKGIRHSQITAPPKHVLFQQNAKIQPGNSRTCAGLLQITGVAEHGSVG